MSPNRKCKASKTQKILFEIKKKNIIFIKVSYRFVQSKKTKIGACEAIFTQATSAPVLAATFDERSIGKRASTTSRTHVYALLCKLLSVVAGSKCKSVIH